MALPVIKTPNASTAKTADGKTRKRAHSDVVQPRHTISEDCNTDSRKRVRLTPLNTNWSNGQESTTQCQTPSSIASPTIAKVSESPIDWRQPPTMFSPHRRSFHGSMSYPQPMLPYHSQHHELFPPRTSVGSDFDYPMVPMVSDGKSHPHHHLLTPEDRSAVDSSIHCFSNAPSMDLPRSVPSVPYLQAEPFDGYSLNVLPDLKSEEEQRERNAPRPVLLKSESSDDHYPISGSAQDSSLYDNPQSLGAYPSPGTYEHSSAPQHDPAVSNAEDHSQSGSKALSSTSHAPSFPSTLVTNPYNLSFNTISPRIQYLLDYYDKAICPVLVTFDGPSNPYRAHIIQRAMHNPGLQHALAALATNNMRMKCLKDVPELRDHPDQSRTFIQACIGAPTPEEQHHKSKSIEYLNAQLGNPSKAKDDSVLATLLILCLFHVCDSGFSKFKTQLAGVQKLLKLRGKSAGPPNGLQDEFVGWVEAFFAWFDVMTAAVNDRETQIEGTALDLGNVNDNLGALEQFSGCDGRLFKLISRLGRLNLLSQGRPVRPSSQELAQAGLSQPSPRVTQTAKDYYSLRFDSPTEDNSDFGHGNAASMTDAEQLHAPKDLRHAFLDEWHYIREKLDAWAPDLDGSSNLAMTHISESFRYAALLYTERLAYPTLPSSSPSIQTLVHQALSHIDDIGPNSCVTKFMLWPLFIAGTECVEESHRELIRARCVEIQKESGFYNNVSGLEVLERVWKENERDVALQRSCGTQAFKWRGCMDRLDGEYIVI
ncbi:MAG: hypothetical protein M1828_001411 [Chrysothrix sp. TS-e1954]|nr:MAG: hypothetical protein M1828_001411 [Chrysothrix sp. TS-e1954]